LASWNSITDTPEPVYATDLGKKKKKSRIPISGGRQRLGGWWTGSEGQKEKRGKAPKKARSNKRQTGKGYAAYKGRIRALSINQRVKPASDAKLFCS
jgi:hypothetical protein